MVGAMHRLFGESYGRPALGWRPHLTIHRLKHQFPAFLGAPPSTWLMLSFTSWKVAEWNDWQQQINKRMDGWMNHLEPRAELTAWSQVCPARLGCLLLIFWISYQHWQVWRFSLGCCWFCFFFFLASCVGKDIYLQDLATLATSLRGAIMVVASFTTGLWSSSTTSPQPFTLPALQWAIPALQRWFVS